MQILVQVPRYCQTRKDKTRKSMGVSRSCLSPGTIPKLRLRAPESDCSGSLRAPLRVVLPNKRAVRNNGPRACESWASTYKVQSTAIGIDLILVPAIVIGIIEMKTCSLSCYVFKVLLSCRVVLRYYC